jgi:hypothetical protein
MMRPRVALPTGHRDGLAGVADHHAAAQAVGGAQRDGAHDAVAELLLHFQRQLGAVHLQGVIDFGHLFALELDVHHGADALYDRSLTHRISPNNKFIRRPQRRRRFPKFPW